MAIASPVPSPSNWQGWPARSKPYMKKYNYYSAAAYLNAFLAYRVGQNTSPGNTYYGATTHNAVVNFQNYWGLTVDGECGPQTWAYVDFFATH